MSATRNALLDGAGVESTGTVSASAGDVAVRAREGATLRLAGASAGDDVVLRTTGQVVVSGDVIAGGGSDSSGFGDTLRTLAGTITLEGRTFDLAGNDVDIRAGTVTLGGTTTATGSGSDVRVQAGGAISLGNASADRDVLVDGTATVSTGVLSAGRDVGVRSTGVGATVLVGGASAGDDVVIRAQGSILVTGDLSSGGGTDSSDADQAGDLIFGAAKSNLGSDLDLAGRTVDVRSGAGSITVLGAIIAATDARLQTQALTGGSVTVGVAIAGRDLLLDGGGAGPDGVVATGLLTATNGDVAARARDGSAIRLAGASAGDDVVLRTAGGVTLTGPVSAGGAADAIGLGDVLVTTYGSVTLEGQAFDLAGHDVDIVGGSLTALALTASGSGSDVRLQSTGAISIGAATAGRDVLIDGAGAITTGLLSAVRDTGVRSTGAGAVVTVAGAMAGDDIVIRARGAITVAGPLATTGGADSAAADQAGDLMFGGARSRLAGDLNLIGRTIDVRSSAGSIVVAGIVIAATDARFQTQAGTGGSIKVGTVTAGRDILLDGGAGAGLLGVEATGVLTAMDGDVAARARDGKAIRLNTVSAGDDVVLRATGDIRSTGVVSTTGRPSTLGLGDRLTDPTEGGLLIIGGLTFDLGNSDIDVSGHIVDIFRTNAAGSTRIKAGDATLGSGSVVGVDILIDSGASLVVGDLTALGDIALRSRLGALTVGRLVAGDDIVLRAALGISAISLKVGGLERLGVGDQLFASDPTGLDGIFDLQGSTIDVKSDGGGITIGSAESTGDVRLQTAAGLVSVSGTIMADRDIVIDGGAVMATGSLTALRDVAINGRSGAVSVGTVSAGDDIVIWAAGDLTATGDLKSGLGAVASGAGDRLARSSGTASLFGEAGEADGSVIDLRAAGINLSGALSAAGASSHIWLRSTGATSLGEATAGGDIAIDAAGDLTARALTAGRDIALRSSTGALSIASASAGDDIVLRAARSIIVSGRLRAGPGMDAVGAADALVALNRTALGGDADLGSQTIDIKSDAADVTVTGDLSATGDVRIQAATRLTTTGQVNANRDVLLDGGEVDTRAVTAGRDIAMRASLGALKVGAATAGDDVVLRAARDITITGAVSAAGGEDSDGVGDRLLATEPTSLGASLRGRNVDLKSTSGGIAVQGSLTASDDIRLLATSGNLAVLEVKAGRDALLDGASLDAQAVTAGRDIALRSATGVLRLASADAVRDVRLEGASVNGGTIRAGRDVAVLALGGAISLGSATAGDDVVLRAATDVSVSGMLSAGGAGDGEGVGDALFATDRTALAGDLGLAGANIDVRARGGIAIEGTATASGDARFQSVGVGEVRIGAVTAGGDVLADGAVVRGTGLISASRDVAVRARAGAVDLASVRAGDDIAIRASGDVKVGGTLASGSGPTAMGAADRLITNSESGAIQRLVDPLAATASIEGFSLATGDIDIRSGGAIALAGDVAAAGASSVRLQAAGKVSTGVVTAGDRIFSRSSDLSLGGTWRAQTVRLEVTASGGLALGEGATAASGGSTLSSSALGMIDAPIVQIFVGDSSGSVRGSTLAIGTLGIDVAKIKTALEFYAGSKAEVVVTGAFAPSSGTTNTTTVRIGAPNAAIGDWTPKSIKVIANNGGSIGASTSATGRLFTDVRAFGSVELNAGRDILIGYQDFIDKLSTTQAASVPQAVKAIIAPQTASGPRILITAGSLTLRANGKVAQQDTSGLLGTIPTGLYLLGGTPGPQLLLGRTSVTSVDASRLPDYIELSGALASGSTILTGQGVSLADGIAFDKGVSPSAYYRLNACAILQPGSCMPSNVHSNISISTDQLTALTVEDQTAAAGTADPTVASATNEEVWKEAN